MRISIISRWQKRLLFISFVFRVWPTGVVQSIELVKKKKKTNTIKSAESEINAPGRLTNQNLHLKWVLAVHTHSG